MRHTSKYHQIINPKFIKIINSQDLPTLPVTVIKENPENIIKKEVDDQTDNLENIIKKEVDDQTDNLENIIKKEVDDQTDNLENIIKKETEEENIENGYIKSEITDVENDQIVKIEDIEIKEEIIYIDPYFECES